MKISSQFSVISYRLSVIGNRFCCLKFKSGRRQEAGVGSIFLLSIIIIFLISFQQQTTNNKQQTSGFKLIRNINIEAKDIQTDRLGNLYVVTKTNQLYKYDSRGDLLCTLNYKYVGNISHIDANNPLEIYIFYKELNKILFIDNNLAYRGEVDLNDFGINQATAVARSFDNGIWVFDASDLQLKRLTKAGEILQKSGNVKQFVNSAISPNFIYDNNDRIFLNDSSTGIHLFTVFANFQKTIHITGCDDFKIIGDDLFYNKNKKLIRYNLKMFSESEFTLPDTTFIQNISIEKDRLYLLKPAEVDIYSY